MTRPNKKADAIRERLTQINGRIAEHPLSSPAFIRAREVNASMPEASPSEIDERLAAEGLPSLGQQAKTMAFGLASLARLNRKRIRLEEKLRTLEANRT